MFDPISSKETKIYVVRDDCPMNTISKKTHHETRYWIIKYVDRKRERVKFKIRTIHEKSIDNKEEECILGSNRRIFERKKEGKEKRLVTRSIKRKKNGGENQYQRTHQRNIQCPICIELRGIESTNGGSIVKN